MELEKSCKLLGYKMDSLHYLMRKLKISEQELYSPVRSREYTQKRWVIMWFYRCAGKTYSEIGRKLHKDHTSVIHGCQVMSDTIKAIAEEYLKKYVSEVLNEKIEIEETPKKKTYIKVPDYKHSKSVVRGVNLEELQKKKVKPHWSRRKWDR